MEAARAALPGFGDWGGRVWLNTAHQGALPLAAAREAQQAIGWKTHPFELTQERFNDVPGRLRDALGRLAGVAGEEIILANSASYGLNLIASAYPWQAGDEILVMEGDFPSDILPWLLLERSKGVKVVRIRPRGRIVEPDELEAAVTSRTRLFCTTWVHSFSGLTAEIDALGGICRNHGVAFVVNGSQAVGTFPLDLVQARVDVLVSVGFKWLCGPYGTGFCWIRPELRKKLAPTKAYWLTTLSAADLEGDLGEFTLKDTPSARGYDVFGTANFFNFVPFAAAVECLLDVGLERIREHDQALVSRFIDGLDETHFRVTSRVAAGPRRSNLIFFTHEDANRNQGLYTSLREEGVSIASRGGSLRLSPHLYNGDADIDRALMLLDRMA